jgi:hypothetical protein
MRRSTDDLAPPSCDHAARPHLRWRPRHRWIQAEIARRAALLTGRRIAFDEIRIDRYADGGIVESWFIPDRFILWQVLGLIGGSRRPGR